MNVRLATTILILASILPLTGCWATGSRIDQLLVTNIVEGTTTEADLVTMFGNPAGRVSHADGSAILTWNYHAARSKPTAMIPIVREFTGGMNMETQMLTVSLAPDGTVRDYSMGGGQSEVRTGLFGR